ncbi:MAG: TonB-dependent receptor [Betaproteobacteria bacterium]|nr:TonB-dependent receptor [Betaproteobacteria bacterium]
MLFLTRTRIALACALGVASLTTVYAADLPPGEIAGQISNAIGVPIQNVRITAQSQNGKILETTQSDVHGYFYFRHLSAGIYALIANKPHYQTGTDIVVLTALQGQSRRITLASEQALSLHVQAKQTHPGPNKVSIANGGVSSYHITSQDIAQMPEGDDTPLNQVLLQAPGVVQDSFGQLHVRGDHANLQYRINGILLPDSVSGFGQTLNSQLISNVNLLTGTLSAEYGFHTAGIVDIHTQTGAFDQGGQVEVMGGDQNTSQASGEIKGHKGDFSYFMDVSGLQNNLGIENPMPTRTAIHDASTQNNGFAYFSYKISDALRASAIFGISDNRFQIPNIAGQTPQYNLNGVINDPSQTLNEQQQEATNFGVLALQGTVGANMDYQVSVFSRYQRIAYSPDIAGDLIYTGVASQTLRDTQNNGVQADGSWRFSPTHTFRTGMFASAEQVQTNSALSMFSGTMDPSTGNITQTSTTPLPDQYYANDQLVQLFGLYAEDEWQATRLLTIDYGLRFDQVNAYVDQHQISPRLSAIYQLTPTTAVHAGYAHYFTPPPNELVSNQQIAGAINTTNQPPGGTQNSPVQSESDDYYDIGINKTLSPTTTAGLDTYYKHVTNLLDEGQFGSALLYTPFNYAQGKIYGAEFTLAYHKDALSSYFNLSRSAAFGKGIESAQYNFSPAELAYIANNYVHLDHDQTWTASSGVSWQQHQFTYSSDLIYGSGLRSGFANTAHLPGYVQINASIMRPILIPEWGKIDVRLIVLNLFGATYEIRNGTGIGVGAPQYGPPRTALVALTKKF